MERFRKATITVEFLADEVARLFATYGDNEVRIFMGFVQMIADATGLDYTEVLREVQRRVGIQKMQGLPFAAPV
jgi:type III secretory pathway component EscV